MSHQRLKSTLQALALSAALAFTSMMAAQAQPSPATPSAARQVLPPTWKTVPTQQITAGDLSFAYRELGQQNGGTPVLLLAHLAAVLDNWDPRIVDGLAARHHVIAFDNRGVGASTGAPANTIEQMADDAIRFIEAKGLQQVDLFGFSMGGMISQEIVLKAPRRLRAQGPGLSGQLSPEAS